MASSDVFVTFGGDTGALEAALATVKAQMNTLTREMKSAASEFTKTGAAADSELGQKLKSLGDKMAAAKDHMNGLKTATNAGGDAIKQMAEKVGNAAYEYGPWTGSHVQLAQVVGGSLASAFANAGAAASAMGLAVGGLALATIGSLAVVGAQVQSLRSLDDAARAAKISMTALKGLNTAGAGVGIDAEQMNTEMAGFALKLREAQVAGGDLADFLEKNNVAIKDAHGNLLPVQQIFGKIAEMILKSNNEMDRLAALAKVGFSSDMLRLFERQTDAVKTFAMSANSAQDDVKKHALEDGEKMSSAWNTAWSEFKESTLSAGVAILDFDAKVRQTAQAFPAMAIAAVKSFAEIKSAANSAAAAIGADIAKIATDQARNAALMRGAAGVASGKSPFGELNVNAFAPPKPKDIAGLYDKDSKASKGAKAPKANRDDENAEMKGYDDSIAAVRTAEKAKETLYAEAAHLHLMSEDQKLASTKAALDEEYNAEKGLLQKELQIDGIKAQQKQALNDKLKALDAKYLSETQKAYMQSVAQQIQAWDHMVDTMSSSLSSGIMGMINGTQTFRQALASMANSIVQQFVKMGTDMAANWAKSMVAQVVMSQTAEGQKTLAAIAGGAARTGVATSEASAASLPVVASALKSITASAAETFGGVFGFLAPIMGPMAAGPAAAAQGAVLSVAAFDIGAWSIPKDQLAMVHQNELIMPAAEAGAFRSMLSGGANGGSGGQGGNTHNHTHSWNVSAVDGASVKSFFANNSRALAEGLNKAIMNGDHLGLSRLGMIR